SAFQVGRIYGGGAADIGFATSTDGGTSWTSGLLSGITSPTGGPYRAASDAVVVFDRAHNVWMIASLAVASGTDLVEVSRSSDALSWGNPTIVSASHGADKPWIACDNLPSSAFYGHCYLQWDDPSPPANGLIWMSTSIDGGLTWSAAVNTAGLAAGLGGQPLVQPNGLVVVPLQSADGKTMLSFTSSDGGASWDAPVTISTIIDHTVAGNLRTIPLPSAAVDASGRVYVVWQDCRFRAACSSNDIVMSTSTDGSNWTAPAGIPIDAVTSTVDHFIPALAIDPATSGSSAHLGLTYYFYPVAQCTAATCTLNVGFISSSDAGATWSAATALAGPMSLGWLPNTSSGLMVADYIATTYSNGNALGVFAVARANAGAAFDQAIYTTNGPLPQMARLSTLPVQSMEAGSAITHHSDHGPRKFYDLDHEHPIPPRRRRR
ncbi:MAG: sialidase family protein, partial [Acidobacteriaceae bacterium]